MKQSCFKIKKWQLCFNTFRFLVHFRFRTDHWTCFQSKVLAESFRMACWSCLNSKTSLNFDVENDHNKGQRFPRSIFGKKMERWENKPFREQSPLQYPIKHDDLMSKAGWTARNSNDLEKISFFNSAMGMCVSSPTLPARSTSSRFPKCTGGSSTQTPSCALRLKNNRFVYGETLSLLEWEVSWSSV